jgi:hypothetical protein
MSGGTPYHEIRWNVKSSMPASASCSQLSLPLNEVRMCGGCMKRALSQKKLFSG